MGPLAGLSIIEFAGIGPGPLAGTFLGDMGADVIRIDRPQGAVALGADGALSRNRRSIGLNLKDPRAVAIALRLMEQADGVFEPFRPGVMERLGLSPEVCLARNSRLVYGRMTGWGQSGPLAQAAGHDINYIAITGALHAMGEADRPPFPPLNLVGDFGGGGLLLAFGMVCALLSAQRTGVGQVVDAAMVDGAASLMGMIYGVYAKGAWSNQRGSNALAGAAHFYGCYECADGKYVAFGSIEPQFYAILRDKLGLSAAAFGDQHAPAQWPALKIQIGAIIKTRTRDEWSVVFEGTDVCFGPVLDLAEAPLHPHNVARGTLINVGGEIQPAPAPRFSGTPTATPRPGLPACGDTEAVLLGAGYTQAEYVALKSAGVVG